MGAYPGDPDDTEAKGRGTRGAPGSQPIGGTPPPVGFAGGFGGGGLSGAPVGPGSQADALRALLRKRLLGTPLANAASPTGIAAPPATSTALTATEPRGGTGTFTPTTGGGPSDQLQKLLQKQTMWMPSMGFPGFPGGGGGGGGNPWTGGGGVGGGPRPDTGIIPPDQRTGDLTDRSYNDPRVAPFVGWDLIKEFLRTGSLGPHPGGLSLDVLRDEAQQQAEAGRQRNELMAMSMDVDPATRASYALRTGLQGQSDAIGGVNRAIHEDIQRREDFGRQILQQLIQGIMQQNIATSSRTSGFGDIGGALGGLGSIIGAFRRPGG